MLDIVEFKERIITLANSSGNIEGIKNLMRDFYLAIAIPVVELIPEFIVRARYNNSGEIFNNTKQLSYNPDAEKITFQRANFPKQQIFYASVPTSTSFVSCSTSALLEVALEYVKNHESNREYFTLSKWLIKKPLNVIILPFSKRSIDRNDDFLKAYTVQNQILDSVFNEEVESTKKLYIEALKFISDLFCERQNKKNIYKITATYFNLMLEFLETKNYKIDGIIYPSANTESAGMNIALKKDLVDEGTLIMNYVTMYKMQRKPNNIKSLFFDKVSDDVQPNSAGNFTFKHIF